MKLGFVFALAGLMLAFVPRVFGAGDSMNLPKTIAAGSAFTIECSGTGKGTLYIVGPGQVLKRSVQLGEAVQFPTGTLYNAGRYLVILATSSGTDTDEMGVSPAAQPARLTFLAKPSRLPVSLRNGISGTAYVFDAYHNLITAPTRVSFALTDSSGGVQKSMVTSQDGAAWTTMNSTAREGSDQFVASVGEVSSKRIVEQVPGDPCGLKMTAQPSGGNVELTTAPVRDCSGNPVPDGTVVTFTARYGGAQTTVDVPLKHGIAQVEIPAHPGARISVASGVVLGNEIVWR